MRSLEEVHVGSQQTVKWIIGSGIARDILDALDIRQGKEIRVVSSCFGNLIVAVNGSRYALGAELAERICV